MTYKTILSAFTVSLMILFTASCAITQKKERFVYDKQLTHFKYPFPVQIFKLNTQNQQLNMAYMDINQTSKKTVLLLHGKNFSGFYWAKIANDLVKKGYRVVMPDQIGFGKSSKPSRYQHSFYNFSLNTFKLLTHLKIDKAIVVGHSMGGMLATHFSYLYPKASKKLILINPIGLEPYLKYVEHKDVDHFYKIELNKTADKIRQYQLKFYYDNNWREEYNHLIEPLIGQINGSDRKLIAWNNALTFGPVFSEDITSKFKHLKNEIILIIGTRDRTGPGRNWKKPGVTYDLGRYDKLGKDLAKKHDNIQLYELNGLGHMPQFENYQVFSDVFFKHF